MKQVKPKVNWPSGEGHTVALLRHGPDAMAERFGFRFERGQDSLDSYALGAISDPAVGQIWFLHHEHAPSPGTEVIVDSTVMAHAAVAALKAQLGLGAGDFEWILPAPRKRPARKAHAASARGPVGQGT